MLVRNLLAAMALFVVVTAAHAQEAAPTAVPFGPAEAANRSNPGLPIRRIAFQGNCCNQGRGGGRFDSPFGPVNWYVDVPAAAVATGVSVFGLAFKPAPPETPALSQTSWARNGKKAASRSDWLSPGGIPSGAKGLPITLASLGGAIGAGILYEDGKSRDGRAVGAAIVIWLEAVGGTLATTELIKLGVRRPRPYTSDAFKQAFPDDYSDLMEDVNSDRYAKDGEAYKSMPSGHTSMAAAVAFTTSTMWMVSESHRFRETGRKKWLVVFPALAEAASLGLTVGVGGLRVEAGKHHVDDVVVGGLIGAAFGIGVPLLHDVLRTKNPTFTRGSAAPIDVNVAVTGTGARVYGSF